MGFCGAGWLLVFFLFLGILVFLEFLFFFPGLFNFFLLLFLFLLLLVILNFPLNFLNTLVEIKPNVLKFFDGFLLLKPEHLRDRVNHIPLILIKKALPWVKSVYFGDSSSSE